MSQAGIINTSSGPVPPTVATQYQTDVNSPSIPAVNIEKVFGGETTTNNVNGIQTDGSSGSNTLTVQLTNRTSVSSTTSDGAGQTQTVTLMTPTNSTSISFRALITGYDVINNESIGGEQIGLARTIGGVVTVVGTNDTFDESDAALINSDWNVISSSPTLSVQFVGVAGHTINWRALFEYTQAP